MKTAYLIFGEDLLKNGIIRNQALPLVKHIGKAGHQVVLISILWGEMNYDHERLQDVAYDLKRSNVDLVVYNHTNFQKTAEEIGTFLKNSNVDLLHCRAYLAASIGKKIQHMFSIPYIFDARGLGPDEGFLMRNEKRSSPIPAEEDSEFMSFKNLENELLHNAAATVVMNDTFAEYFTTRYPQANKVRVIRNFVDFERFSYSEGARDTIRKELGIDDCCVFVFSGSLSPWIDFEKTADFFQVTMKRDNVRLLILSYHDISSGVDTWSSFSDIFSARGVSSKKIIFKEARPSEVAKYLSAADVGLLLHKKRYKDIVRVMHPIKFGEYLACGLPVVVADINPTMVNTLSSHPECGWVLSENNMDQVTRDIKRYIERDGKNNRIEITNVAKERFHIKDSGDAYLDLYEEVTSSISGRKHPLEKDTKLKVLAYTSDVHDYACAQLRLHSPFKALKNKLELLLGVDFVDGGDRHLVSVNDLDKADIIKIQRLFPRKDTDFILDTIFSTGKPVIYELDDMLLELPHTNPVLDEALQATPFIKKVMHNADAVVVTSPEMRKKLKKYNKRIYIFPNFLDESIWTENISSKGHESDRQLVIGYAGTITHQDDLKIIEDVLIAIDAKYKGKVHFKFWGCSTPTLMNLSSVELNDFHLSYSEYAKMMLQEKADIVLCPLQDNTFNKCKSNIKWLEYSICGFPGIYSDLPPYAMVEHNKTGIKVQNSQNAWYEALDDLILDSGKRERIAAEAQAEVRSKYMLSRNADRYYSIIDDVLQSKGIQSHSLLGVN